MVAMRSVVVMMFVLAACGGGGDAADTSAPDTTAPPTDTSVPDTSATTVSCCPLGNCGVGLECVSGACLPKTTGDQCYYDGECPSGATCEGATRCGCGAELASCTATPGTCHYPTGCCNGDGDCSGGAACIAGQCRAPSDAGTCWRDDQCQSGESCDGAVACACGDTSCTAVIGHCGAAGICCSSDAECGAGVCRAGRCLAHAASGACWGDDDCQGGETCLGESLCTCAPGHSSDASCVVPSTPGRCGVAADVCCTDDTSCGDGKICVDGKGCVKAPNRAPSRDECWVDAHCGLGRTCKGASLCGCDGGPECVEKIGKCTTDVIACDSGTCPVGMRCIAPDALVCVDDLPVATLDETSLYPQHVCVTDVDRVNGACWQTSDCTGGLRCGAEEVCVDADGCDRPNVPGQCRMPVELRNCCDAHNDCEPGLECRNSDASLTCPIGEGAVCLPKPELGESCWNLYDCPAGKTCQQTMICGCNGKCRWNHMGVCLEPTFCDTDLDCGSDSVCAHDTECILSPCTTQSTCPIGGRCQLEAVDEDGNKLCWNTEECGAGMYCDGLRVCPADRTCVAPDVPGRCAPRAALGECCSSLRGCEPGLRCVSPTQRNGCRADFSSVCVPAVTFGSDCYGDDDCDSGQRCSGAVICPCGVEDCTSPPQPGQCILDN